MDEPRATLFELGRQPCTVAEERTRVLVRVRPLPGKQLKLPVRGRGAMKVVSYPDAVLVARSKVVLDADMPQCKLLYANKRSNTACQAFGLCLFLRRRAAEAAAKCKRFVAGPHGPAVL